MHLTPDFYKLLNYNCSWVLHACLPFYIQHKMTLLALTVHFKAILLPQNDHVYINILLCVTFCEEKRSRMLLKWIKKKVQVIFELKSIWGTLNNIKTSQNHPYNSAQQVCTVLVIHNQSPLSITSQTRTFPLKSSYLKNVIKLTRSPLL